MLILGTDQDKVVVRKGVKWWAEAGLVHTEDQNTGEYVAMTVRDALIRVKALNDMIGNSKANPEGIAQHYDEIVELQDFVNKIVQLCEQARQQGRPDDPKHVAQMIRDARTRRTFCAPSRNAMM